MRLHYFFKENWTHFIQTGSFPMETATLAINPLVIEICISDEKLLTLTLTSTLSLAKTLHQFCFGLLNSYQVSSAPGHFIWFPSLLERFPDQCPCPGRFILSWPPFRQWWMVWRARVLCPGEGVGNRLWGLCLSIFSWALTAKAQKPDWGSGVSAQSPMGKCPSKQQDHSWH